MHSRVHFHSIDDIQSCLPGKILPGAFDGISFKVCFVNADFHGLRSYFVRRHSRSCGLVARVSFYCLHLWGAKVSSSTVSELNQKIYGKIEDWRKQPITGEHPYVFVDGVYLKRSWGGEVQNVSVLVAVGVNDEGYREILGVAEGRREDKESWSNT